jgi:GNAT superfamily N-acetyltransferase
MKLNEILTESKIKYITPYDENGEYDYEKASTAEALVSSSGLRMLRNDEITDIALSGDKVVGVLYSSVDDNEMRTSIAVDPKYRGQQIATTLCDNMVIDEFIDKHVAELIPPYTLEPFLINRGYTFVTKEREFKIYEKIL